MYKLLIDILQAQSELYSELLETSRQKKASLLSSDIEAIRLATVRENGLIGRLRKTESEREKITADLTAKIHIPASGLTLADLISRVDDTATRGQLNDLRARIRSLMDELKAVNERNRVLINQSLEYIDFSMNLLRNAVSVPNYPGAEEIHGQVFFDARG